LNRAKQVRRYKDTQQDIAAMCGRFTRNDTWHQLNTLYRLTAPAAIPNAQPRFSVCPTDPADEPQGARPDVDVTVRALTSGDTIVARVRPPK
jgi:hypothetical protein